MDTQAVVLYILDVIILIRIILQLGYSKKVEIETYMGPRWAIPAVFWGIGVLGFVRFTGAQRIIQTIALAVMGILYFGMKSGLSPDGVVMMGKLYRYEKIKPITFSKENFSVFFSVRHAPTEVHFDPEQMQEVRNYLSRYAGLPKKEVR